MELRGACCASRRRSRTHVATLRVYWSTCRHSPTARAPSMLAVGITMGSAASWKHVFSSPTDMYTAVGTTPRCVARNNMPPSSSMTSRSFMLPTSHVYLRRLCPTSKPRASREHLVYPHCVCLVSKVSLEFRYVGLFNRFYRALRSLVFVRYCILVL